MRLLTFQPILLAILSLILPIILMSFPAFAQPSEERISQIQRLNGLMHENKLSLSCERKIEGEKTELQFFPFENRLITTMTVSRGKTGWSAQNDILALKLAKMQGENTHLILGFVQRGPQGPPTLHLQMGISEESISLMGHQTGQGQKLKQSFKAYEKNGLNHPFSCRFYGQR